MVDLGVVPLLEHQVPDTERGSLVHGKGVDVEGGTGQARVEVPDDAALDVAFVCRADDQLVADRPERLNGRTALGVGVLEGGLPDARIAGEDFCPKSARQLVAGLTKMGPSAR